jgi:hypothetical protein
VGLTVGDVGDRVGNGVGEVDGADDGMVVGIREGFTVGDVGDSVVGNEVGAMQYSQLQAIEEEPESLKLYHALLFACK